MSFRAPRSVPLLGDLPAFRRDRLAFLTELARDQGDLATFRIGPYRVHQVAHPEWVHDVLVTHAQRFRKGPVLQRAKVVLGEGLLTAEGEHHRRSRRLMQPAFHPRRIAGYAPTMVVAAQQASDRWTEGHDLDIHREMVQTTLATAGTTLLGADVQDDLDLVERALADLFSAYKLGFLPFGWYLQHLPVGPGRRLRRGRAALHDLVDRALVQDRVGGEGRGDLLSALALVEEGERLSQSELREQALTLLLAGHETTANTLAFALHLVAGDEHLDARVHAELRAVLGTRPPTVDDIGRLKVCHGVVAESLRLYPPSWAMSRQVSAETTIGGRRLAVGEIVICPQWVVHRDPRWWHEPLVCDPDRWGAEARKQQTRWSYFPFGAGGRRCLGESFAWTEAVLALATILRHWRFRPVASRPLALDPLITLRPREGLWLAPEARRG
jgi:cytochrome P450